jgi:translation initiation factor eIF-2B subunit beta
MQYIYALKPLPADADGTDPEPEGSEGDRERSNLARAQSDLARLLGFRGTSGGGGVLTMSMQDMLLHQETQPQMPNPKDVRALRQEVIADIGEFITEITDIHANVADFAIEHIHANEVIMTFGESNTVSAFLEAAAAKIYFDVIVVESAPTYRGHAVARRLSQAGIMVTVIPDSAIFAMMGRCNKVIMGTHAVLANGGIIAPSGSALLASAAGHHSVPLLVVSGLYKLSPLYPHDLVSTTDHRPPSQLMTFEEAGGLTRTAFFNPGFDYIAPEKVSLFISHMGGATPSYIYRLLAEYYD